MQFSAQARYYEQAYAGASFEVIEVDGTPAGRLYLAVGPLEIRIVDITLLPKHRQRGIGGGLLHNILEQGHATGRSVKHSRRVRESGPAAVRTSRLQRDRAARDIYANGVEVVMMERRVFLAGVSAAVAGTAVFSPYGPLTNNETAAPGVTRVLFAGWLGSEFRIYDNDGHFVHNARLTGVEDGPAAPDSSNSPSSSRRRALKRFRNASSISRARAVR